jgi:hypothetical protein
LPRATSETTFHAKRPVFRVIDHGEIAGPKLRPARLKRQCTLSARKVRPPRRSFGGAELKFLVLNASSPQLRE